MCLQQSTSHGPCNRRRLLIAGAVVFAAAFIAVIVIAVVRVKGNKCMRDLECLPLSKCEGHINPDFNYGCGSHDTPKICCIAKKNDSENFGDEDQIDEIATASRIAKMALLPKICGIGDIDNKIANGLNATLGMFPWMVILGYRLKGLEHIINTCGGTIINDRYILTAAHCINSDHLTLSIATLGDLNLVTPVDCETDEVDGTKYCADDPVSIPIEKIIPHEKFNKTSLKNDIALLRLKQNITEYTDYIKPICLPFGLKIDEDYFLTRSFTISGWGKTSDSSVGVSNILQYTTVQPWTTDKCNEAFKVPYSPVEDRQVCATGPNFTEACIGDSGGPMTYNHLQGVDLRATQLGVVSFKSFDSCGTEHVPTVFTRVDRYLDWILDNIEP